MEPAKKSATPLSNEDTHPEARLEQNAREDGGGGSKNDRWIGRWSAWLLPFSLCVVGYTLALAYPIFSHDKIHSIDGMFHIRYAWLYRQHGVFTEFPWMQYAIARETWADHHFLYHLLLIPFTGGDLLFGMKLASVVFGVLALAACTLYLMAHRVRFVWVYALCLLGASDIFLFRLSMARSISISLVFLILALWCLERRHDRALFIVAFGYIWAYQAATALIPMAFVAVVWWRWQEGGWSWRPLLAVVGGILVGMTLHPFVPDTFSFFAFHFGAAFPGQGLVEIPKIPEWRGTTFGALCQRNAPALLLGALVPLLALPALRRWPRDSGIVVMGALALLVVSLRAERFLEYGVPFAILAGARLLDALVIQPQEEEKALFFRERWWGAWKLLGMLFVLFVLWFGVRGYRDFSRYAFAISPREFRDAAVWLRHNTPKNSVIYHTDWAEFSYLFFHNTHNRYIAGLSPLFLAGWKPSLYQAYRQINEGRSPDPVRSIKALFQSRYIVLYARKSNMALAAQLLRDPRINEVFGDERIKILDLGEFSSTTTKPHSAPSSGEMQGK
jgi:hypothetical protein